MDEKIDKLNQDIYNMKLHETIEIHNVYITRVPGGWLYSQTFRSGIASTFVPYTNKPREELKESVNFTYY